MSQSELEVNTSNRTGRQARENACEQVKIGFDFGFHQLRKWREFLFFSNQSRTVEMQDESKCEISQLKTAP